jgi:hypothetical protein
MCAVSTLTLWYDTTTRTVFERQARQGFAFNARRGLLPRPETG